MTYLNMTGMLYTGGGSMSSPRVRDNSGFTLIEMIIAIVVAAVLMLVAIPNMRDWKLEQDLATKAEAVISEMDLARTTAQQSNQMVTIQPNPRSGLGRDWNAGFTTFINNNYVRGRGDLDNGETNGEIVSKFDITDNDMKLSVSGGGNIDNDVNIRFLPNGMSGLVDADLDNVMSVNGAVTIRLCRKISKKAITWTIVMRSAGDFTKDYTSVADGQCNGF